MSSNPLRRAVGEPETEIEQIAVAEIEHQPIYLSVPSGSGNQKLRFTQELPGIERAIYSDLKRSQGPTLRSSGVSSVSLTSLRTLVEELLGTALDQLPPRLIGRRCPPGHLRAAFWRHRLLLPHRQRALPHLL